MSLINSLSPNNIAKFAHRCGFEKISTKILENNFGKQYGKTSKSGLRAFCHKTREGEEFIELIDKNFNRRGFTIINRGENNTLKRVKRFIFDNGKTRETTLYKYTDIIHWGRRPHTDKKYVHHIDEYGSGIKQRVGHWEYLLPSRKTIIQRNDDHILDNIV